MKTGERQAPCPQLSSIGGPLSGVLDPGKGEFLVHMPSSLPLLSCTALDLGFALCRLLMAGTKSSSLQEIVSLLESNNDLLLTSSYLSASPFTGEHVELLVTQFLNATRSHLTNDSRWCSWGLSQKGLLTSFVPDQLLRLYQLLLFTLPGTPVFSYGDEIGLKAAALPGQVFSSRSGGAVFIHQGSLWMPQSGVTLGVRGAACVS